MAILYSANAAWYAASLACCPGALTLGEGVASANTDAVDPMSNPEVIRATATSFLDFIFLLLEKAGAVALKEIIDHDLVESV